MRPLELPVLGHEVVEGLRKQPFCSLPKDKDPVMMQAILHKFMEENTRLCQARWDQCGRNHSCWRVGGRHYSASRTCLRWTVSCGTGGENEAVGSPQRTG